MSSGLQEITVEINDSNIQGNPQASQSGFGRYFCCFSGGRSMDDREEDPSPNKFFNNQNIIRLPHGYTAYKYIKPMVAEPDNAPLVVLLHGMLSCSYMWGELTELLTNFDQGPQSQVLVYDFYGRGRSPWIGGDITLDVLVNQLHELLNGLGLSRKLFSIIGYDLGGAVGVGFSAKYPNRVLSMTLISPLGIKYKPGINEKPLHQKYFGEFSMAKQKHLLPKIQTLEYFTSDDGDKHKYLIDLQIEMIKWQMKNSPGYLGAILSTFRNFPLKGMDELFAAVGKHPRKVLIIWGSRDIVCPYSRCIETIEQTFPKALIVDILDCGHNCLFEKFEESCHEILNFQNEVIQEFKLTKVNQTTS